ncbi:hypothetical protein [Actinophytocola oryzae]|uniref:Uncharacterized protein n=1 Tax=Actinophytocola oryzae TaxID=502181 RepID=A0A4V3FU43_9PSEU|nr:hypothetical protein [Actinophytocola oryzae]TDV53771.1 hypothetical protein CLV71_104239 [Actinophytocola oryzae]
MGTHVERIEPLAGRERLLAFRWVSFIMVLPAAGAMVLICLIHGVTEALVHRWPGALVFALVMMVAPLAFVTVFTFPHPHADRERVSLLVDEEGVYLGGRRPYRIAWADLAEVALITRRGIGDVYFVAFRRHGAKRKANYLKWRPRRRCVGAAPFDSVERAVREHAPTMWITSVTVR